MSELNPVVGVTIHCALFLSGTMGNTAILIIHFLDWLKTHEVNPCDLIINCIVLSNLFLQGTVVFNEICFFMFELYYIQTWVVNVLATIMSSLSFSSLWCSTCLCFYYCVKIINLSGSCFHKLKANIATLVPWLLFLSISMSCIVGLPLYWDLYINVTFSNSSLTRNQTRSDFSVSFKTRCNCILQLYMAFSSVAFTFIFITAGAIITSLCKHMKRLKQNSESFGNAKVSSHLSAAKTVSFLLVLYLTFYGALNAIFNETTEIGTWMFSLCFIVVSSFPTINSIILITGNRKLTNAVRHLLGRKSTSGNTEVSVTNK